MQFLGVAKPDPELVKALKHRAKRSNGAELHEQRISFAFGNAPASATNIRRTAFASI